MGDSITGGGLHGKDLSKADVSVNIYCFLKAQETGKEIEISCAIGDEFIDNKPYSEIVENRENLLIRGGFEKFAEWGIDMKNYGIPYMGSKTKILPLIHYLFEREYKCKYFIDMFCGGLAVSHYALENSHLSLYL